VNDVRLDKEEVLNSLRKFKSRRDGLLHEDVPTFDHNFERFLEYCGTDPLAKSVLGPIEASSSTDVAQWWSSATHRPPRLSFPADADEELALRYRIIKSAQEQPAYIFRLGIAHGQSKHDSSIELFRTLVLRPFLEELSQRLGTAADLATPEARDLQAVPISRLLGRSEGKIFLSHKSVDKPLVYRYYQALKILGFDPWLDEPNMPVGSNLERELLRGFQESCAAVFFITANFVDEKYLATEVDYAIMQKRAKGNKFAIITLRHTDASPVPGLLTPYIYKDVANDLEGFHSLLRALPIELGPTRWKADVV
jgi:TIR domain